MSEKDVSEYELNTGSIISVEGVNLPNKALTNFELLDAVKKLKIQNFRGVFMRNDLPRRPLKRESGILNLGDTSTNGTHWVCWTKNNNKNNVKIMITFISIPLGL